MSLRGARILLTGGAGFIGSHVAETLIDEGAILTIVDNFDEFYDSRWKRANVGDLRNRGAFELIEADICDSEAMSRMFETVQPELVVHLAARAGIRPSLEQPLLYERVNVSGTLNLLELARRFKVTRFVFGSSSSVYGAASRAPFSEAQGDLRPVSPYAATKLAAETLCYTYAHLYDIPIVSLRFFTVYGPRQRPDLAIHKFTALIEHGQPLRLFDLSSGRDYTHITDIVRGVRSAMTHPVQGDTAPFEVFNLGNSRPIKLAELVEMLENITGRKAIREIHQKQPGDVPLTWADIRKAAERLGYTPNMGIEEGLLDFVSWYRAAGPERQAKP
jgi:UDP-glucuronate 4-epimerase